MYNLGIACLHINKKKKKQETTSDDHLLAVSMGNFDKF